MQVLIAMENKEASGELSEDDSKQLKVVSAPIPPLVPETDPKLKTQISAPSYWRSLAENELPPFKRPEREARPILLVGGVDPLVAEDDVVEMIATACTDANGLKVFLAEFLVKKKVIRNYELSERNFLLSWITECIDYAAQRDFPAYKLACLMTVYLTAHVYFKWYYWSSPAALWSYFKELMIRHTIEDSPDGQEVFEPDECYDIITHFHATYVSNLPLVHIATFGSHRLRLGWTFKLK